jgi:predicted DNA-binding transcriptional regulator YafY
MDRNERLLRLIIVLRRASSPLTRRQLFASHPAYSASDIKPESILRTFERDKLALRSMGLPLEVLRDDQGEELGYRLTAGKRPALRCSSAERMILAAAADSLAAVSGIPLRAAALNALAKLVEQPVEEEVAKRGNALLERIVEALERGKSLVFSYRSRRAAKARKVELDDALLELRGSYWYVTGYDRARESDRSFRLDRIQGSLRGMAPGSGRRTQGAWSRWQQSVDPPLEADLEAGALAGPLPKGLTVVERLTDDSVRVRTRNRLALMRWLCAAPGWKLRGPVELQNELAERLGRLMP